MSPINKFSPRDWFGISDMNNRPVALIPADDGSYGLPVVQKQGALASDRLSWVSYKGATATTSTAEAFMLVDRSKTAIFPHAAATTLVIEKIIISIDTPSTWTADLQVGLLSNVTTTDASLTILNEFDLVASKNVNVQFDYGDGVNAGNLLASSADSLAAFNTGTSIAACNGELYASGDGDIVLYKPAGGASDGLAQWTVQIGYRSQ